VPGWDCHGLPIEQKVSRELKDQNLTLSTAELRAKCDEFSETWIAKQTAQFKRVGVLADWKNEYKTKAPAFEADILRTFAAFVEQDNHSLVGDHIGERDRFLDHALADLLGAAFADFHNFRIAETDPAAGLLGAFAIALGQFPFRAVLEPTNRRNDQPHGRLPAFAHVLVGKPVAAFPEHARQLAFRPREPAHIFSKS